MFRAYVRFDLFYFLFWNLIYGVPKEEKQSKSALFKAIFSHEKRHKLRTMEQQTADVARSTLMQFEGKGFADWTGFTERGLLEMSHLQERLDNAVLMIGGALRASASPAVGSRARTSPHRVKTV